MKKLISEDMAQLDMREDRDAKPHKGRPARGGGAWLMLTSALFLSVVAGCSEKDQAPKDSVVKDSVVEEEKQSVDPPLDLPAETRRGEELLDWVRKSHDISRVKMEEEFAKLKGEYVVISGKVMNVDVHNGKTYVQIKNDRSGYSDYMGIAFYVPDSLKSTVASWMVDDARVMRGRVTYGWFSVPMLNIFCTQCDKGQVIRDGKVFVPEKGGENEKRDKRTMEDPGPESPRDLAAEVQAGEKMLAWSNFARTKMTTLQQKESFPELKGMYVAVSGKVRDIDTEKGEMFVSLLVDWKCREIGFLVPESLKATVVNWKKDEEHVMRGRIVRCTWGKFVNRIYCDRSELVPEDKFRAANGRSFDERRKSR